MAPLFESGMSTNSIISANTGGGATPSFERPARCSLPHVDWRLVYLVPAPRPAAVIVLSGAQRVFSTPYLSFGLLETENQSFWSANRTSVYTLICYRVGTGDRT